jgi:hypothetical protein
MSEHEVRKGPSGSSSDDRADGPRAPSGRRGTGPLLLLRVGLPVMLATAGLVLLLLGLLPIGVVFVGTAIIAALVDFFARMTNESDLERGREEQARREFMATGRWPRRRG